jgi:hypothetical protein
MIQDLNPTTRCFPRTLNEAFPQDSSNWIEEPEESIGFWDLCMVIVSLTIWVIIIKFAG